MLTPAANGVALLLLILSCSIACSNAFGPVVGTPVLSAGPKTYRVGPFKVIVAPSAVSNLSTTVEIYTARLGRTEVLQWSATAALDGGNGTFVGLAGGDFTVTEHSGAFRVSGKAKNRTRGQTIDAVQQSNFGLTLQLSGRLFADTGLFRSRKLLVATYVLQLSYNPKISRRALGFKVTVDNVNPAYNRLYVSWDAADAGENFYGFGEQYTFHGLRGRTVPIFSTEQGVGRGLQPISSIIDAMGRGHDGAGNWHTTYTAMPHFITNRLRSVFFEDTRYMEFDLCAERGQDIVDVMIAVGPNDAAGFETSGYLIEGEDPKSLIETYTSFSGRMGPLPQQFTKGLIVGWEGGTDVVRKYWRQVVDAGVKVSAIWLQDWTGVRTDTFGTRLWWNWELDTTFYHDWKSLVDEVESDGAVMTTYINPFLASNIAKEKVNYTRNLFKEAADLGYLVKNKDGEPYILTSGSTTFTFGTIDLTNPSARAWTRKLIRCNMLGDQSGCTGNATAISAPIRGYMSDFAEYIPWDSYLWNGQSAAEVHNEFPKLWAQTCREAQIEAGLEHEVVFWSRSASRKSPSHATCFWAGDQITTWDVKDGLKSALLGMLSGGLSGMSLSHSDIGGYTMVDKLHYKLFRTQELLQRWAEMSAFSGALYRTHPGLLPAESAQIITSNATIETFRVFSRVFAALAPYKALLSVEAKLSGLPLARHMFLEFPSDPNCWNTTAQFMLGSELLVAPVLDPNIALLRTYVPKSSWALHNWNASNSSSTTIHSKGEWMTFAAPIGEPVIMRRLRFVESPLSLMLAKVLREPVFRGGE